MYYGDFRAVREVDLDVRQHEITAFIGPSGCGKIDGAALLQPDERPDRAAPASRARSPTTASTSTAPTSIRVEVRRRIGMVFQKPNPFPKSIYDNVAYGPRLAGVKKRAELDDIVERSLRGAALWDEVQGPAQDARRSACPAVSSSGCASPGRSPSSRR